MNHELLRAKIEKDFPGTALKLVRESILVENPADIVKVADFLKTDAELKLDYLSSLTGADYLEFLETVYHLYSMEKKTGPLVLRVRVGRHNPRVPSLVPLFRAAEFQEREAYDTYGIIYEGHPDLRRVFMWDGFEGFPMRKDYSQEDSETLEAADIEWLDKHKIQVPDDQRKKAEELKSQGKRAIAQKPTEKEII